MRLSGCVDYYYSTGWLMRDAFDSAGYQVSGEDVAETGKDDAVS